MNARGHYIAQFHLRNFKVDRDEVQRRRGKTFRKRPHVWRCNLTTSLCELVPVRDCAYQVDLYSQLPAGADDTSDEQFTDNAIEHALSKVEGIASPHIEKLRRRGAKIDADTLGYIIEYAMIQFCRTPARLEAISSALARAMRASLRAAQEREQFVPELVSMTLYDRDSIDGSTERLSRIDENVAVQKRTCWGTTLGSVDILLDWAGKASWEALWAPDGDWFVIGDDPVVMLNPHDPSGLHDGLAYEGTEIAMPLSPYVALCGRVLPGGTHTRSRPAEPSELTSLNARQFLRARDAVFGKARPATPSAVKMLAYQPLSP
jgi:hypothetical protein